MEPEILELESFLPYRLYRLADAVSREFSKVYRDRHGLTRPEWRTLSGLGQRGTMTATALGEQSAMHKTKVSRAVAELERRRWLTRTSDENDRRVEHLALTKAGLAAYLEMVPLAKAFSWLLADGYEGTLSVEWEYAWHPELEPPESALPAALKTVRELLVAAQTESA